MFNQIQELCLRCLMFGPDLIYWHHYHVLRQYNVIDISVVAALSRISYSIRSIAATNVCSSKESDVEVSFRSSKNQTRTGVCSLLRNIVHVLLSASHRSNKLVSSFDTSC